jgi:hypothetical protein
MSSKGLVESMQQNLLESDKVLRNVTMAVAKIKQSSGWGKTEWISYVHIHLTTTTTIVHSELDRELFQINHLIKQNHAAQRTTPPPPPPPPATIVTETSRPPPRNEDLSQLQKQQTHTKLRLQSLSEEVISLKREVHESIATGRKMRADVEELIQAGLPDTNIRRNWLVLFSLISDGECDGCNRKQRKQS